MASFKIIQSDSSFLRHPEGSGFEAGERFLNTHFRITTKTYQNSGNVGFANDIDKQAFYSSSKAALEMWGYESKDDSPYVYDAFYNARLHIHPSSISGVIPFSSIEPIGQILSQLKPDAPFKFFHVDTYEAYEDVSEKEVKRRISALRDRISRDVLVRFLTNRKSEFRPVISYSFFLPVHSGFRFIKSDPTDYSLAASSSSLGMHYELAECEVKAIFDRLVDSDMLKVDVRNGKPYYRTANKTERRLLPNQPSAAISEMIMPG